jgi:ABC-type Na+ efflux pump permease subunit
MSILAKIDDQLTTQVLENIGKATVQAFGTATDLAKVGAEHTVRYVQVQGMVVCGICVLVWLLFLAAIVILAFCMKHGMDEEDLIIPGLPCMFLGVASVICLVIATNYAPQAIEPTGYIIHEALTKR